MAIFNPVGESPGGADFSDIWSQYVKPPSTYTNPLAGNYTQGNPMLPPPPPPLTPQQAWENDFWNRYRTDTNVQQVDINDLSDTQGLPGWAQNFVNTQTGKAVNPAWESYQSAIMNLGNQQGNIEASRKASEEQYYGDVNRSLQAATRMGARGLAAKGQTDSSVSGQLVGQIARDAVSASMKAQEANAASEEAKYKNAVQTAQATQAMSGMVGEYLAKAAETYTGGLYGLDLNPGNFQESIQEFAKQNPSGSGTWDLTTGLQEGETYGKKTEYGPDFFVWERPKDWVVIKEEVYHPQEGEDTGSAINPKYGVYSFGGQTFMWDSTTGRVRNVEGTLDANELAGHSGISEEAKAQVKQIVEKYGDPSMRQSIGATENLANYDTAGAANRLTGQYGGMSDRTMGMLQSALAKAGLGYGGRYGAQRQGAAGSAAAYGRSSVANATDIWRSRMQQQQAADTYNARNSMVTQLGQYLGYTGNSVDRNVNAYLSMYSPTFSE